MFYLVRTPSHDNLWSVKPLQGKEEWSNIICPQFLCHCLLLPIWILSSTLHDPGYDLPTSSALMFVLLPCKIPPPSNENYKSGTVSQAPYDLLRKLVQLSVSPNIVDKSVGPLVIYLKVRAIVDNLESIYHLSSQRVILSSTQESWEYSVKYS